MTKDTKYFIDKNGAYLGAFFDIAKKPKNSIEVSSPPDDGRQIYDVEKEEWRDFIIPHEELRKHKYPDLSEFADAYVKQAAYDRMQNDREFIQPMDDYINKCLAVKDKYPKQEDKDK